IRPQGEDRVDLRAGERADLRLLAARARRTDGEAADAADPALLPAPVQDLGRLLREADAAAPPRAHAPPLRKYTTRSVSSKPKHRCAACDARLSISASEASSAQPRERVQSPMPCTSARPTPRPRQSGSTYQASRNPTGEVVVPLT